MTPQRDKFVYLCTLIQTEWEEIIPHNPESKLEHVISIRDKYFVVNRLERGRVSFLLHLNVPYRYHETDLRTSYFSMNPGPCELNVYF